jgi:cobalt-zinc-cadmium efflux system protein
VLLMAHAHSHDHGHSHGHSHGVAPDADQRQLAIALGLILALMAAEVVVGLVAHSLALLSDAGHMLTDAGAIGLSLWVARLALRPAHGAMTYGYRRAEILSAQANGVTLLVLSVLIVFEAVRRLFEPPTVEAKLILGVALAGVVVNLLATWVLARANRTSLNVEGSFQHILTDLYAFIGTAVAAVVILATDFQRADPIASLFVAALMLRAAYGLLRASGRIFLEAAPEGLEVEQVGHALAGQPGVVEVHDLHVWEVTSGFPSLSAHVIVEEDGDCHGTRRELERLLHDRFGIDHTTLQVEHRQARLLQLSPKRVRPDR